MDPALLEPYYIELGHLIQVNKMCQGDFAIHYIQLCSMLTPLSSGCGDLANSRLL